ncbi:G-patch domain-containing protein [Zalerion maritima]|uniref:G-patch domain-containing protein n=1 Tax=Zalerion maritima TaxID=339359 RepID=A0AAD5WW92_9PEZI|nr:G-patch domain-containing protein [Zalerion maritima]
MASTTRHGFDDGKRKHPETSPEDIVEEEEEEEDYMTMTFPSSVGRGDNTYSSSSILSSNSKPAVETSLQRRARLKREGEMKGKFKSKAELAAVERERREEKLSKSLLEDPNVRKSKAFRMMQKMGFQLKEKADGDDDGDGGCEAAQHTAKVGTGDAAGGDGSKPPSGEDVVEAGKQGDKGEETEHTKSTRKPGLEPTAEPIRIRVKEDRSGIGHDTAQRKRLAEAMTASASASSPQPDAKKPKPADEGEFRHRVRREGERARSEKLVRAAQKVAEKFYDDDDEEDKNTSGGGNTSSKRSKQSLTSVPVLWRSLVKERQDEERQKRKQKELDASLSLTSRLPRFDKEEEYDRDDMQALGMDTTAFHPLNGELGDEDEDAELEEFNALDSSEKLIKLATFLRDKYKYCFWCKYRYTGDQEMKEACPGSTGEEHD